MDAGDIVVDPMATQILDWGPQNNPYSSKSILAVAIDDECHL